MQPNDAFPGWELRIVSVTVNVPLDGDVEMIQIILKCLERSWVCPFPGQYIPLKLLDLELFPADNWTQHFVLDGVGCA